MTVRSTEKGVHQGTELIEVPPYVALARYYEEVMEHVDYHKWALYITRLANRSGKHVREITDLACGTGTLARELALRGYHLTGVDGSEAMIQRAKESGSPDRYNPIRYFTGDLREPPPVREQDMVLCLYDSLNYLMESPDVHRFFASARKILAKNGLLVYDLSTEFNSRRNFNGYEISEKIKGASYHRKAYFDAGERIQNNIFELHPEGESVIYIEHHKQRVWSISQTISILKSEGLKKVAVYNGLTFHPGNEKSSRVHIVAKPV